MIADYRLTPEAKFPNGSEDVRDAVAWIVAHADEVTKDSDVKIDIEKVFLLGHSAGASHVVTTFLLPGFLPADLRSRVKGLILTGGPYTFRPELLPPAAAVPDEVLEQYYGPKEQMYKNEPLGLLVSAPQELLDSLPPFVIAWSEKEVPAIEQMNLVFAKAFKEKVKVGSAAQEYIAKGHNHISPSMCLSSGEGEEWADYVVSWIGTKTG